MSYRIPEGDPTYVARDLPPLGVGEAGSLEAGDEAGWRAVCVPCGYEQARPTTRAGAQAAAVQHSLGDRHRQLITRRRPVDAR